MVSLKQKVYCESCGRENLKDYIVDSTGSIFCDDSCFADSLEYRNLSPKKVKIVREFVNNKIVRGK